jgi:hypothetical protein
MHITMRTAAAVRGSQASASFSQIFFSSFLVSTRCRGVAFGPVGAPATGLTVIP